MRDNVIHLPVVDTKPRSRKLSDCVCEVYFEPQAKMPFIRFAKARAGFSGEPRIESVIRHGVGLYSVMFGQVFAPGHVALLTTSEMRVPLVAEIKGCAVHIIVQDVDPKWVLFSIVRVVDGQSFLGSALVRETELTPGKF